MLEVRIRNRTDGWSSRGLIAIFNDGREPVYGQDAKALLEALSAAGVPHAALIVESPEGDSSDNALTRSQYSALQAALESP